ncbi:hypothetical protein CSQ90_26590 [Janthinobacterium sp. BJB303]|nr:hypothetical protein CSQ90_26590 [Janthinobacterium sp. BJB303]
MAANKKPRKRSVQKPAVLPPGARSAMEFEMPGFQVSEAIGKFHFLGRWETILFGNKFIDINFIKKIINK